MKRICVRKKRGTGSESGGRRELNLSLLGFVTLQ